MNGLKTLDWVVLVLVIVGGLNWLLVGAANWNLVTAIFGDGSTMTKVVYDLVGLSALYLVFVVGKLGRK